VHKRNFPADESTTLSTEKMKQFKQVVRDMDKSTATIYYYLKDYKDSITYSWRGEINGIQGR